MRSPSKVFAIAVLVAAELAACGGAQDTPPVPLAMHFDDMYIAAIPPEEKMPVVQSQNDWQLARMENAKADIDLKESDIQVAIAYNDQKAAKLGIDSAETSKKAADASADTNRINQATKDLHTAQDVAKAAEERIKFLEAHRDYLRVVQRYSQENMYWRESQYELAKAQAGQKAGKAPTGVSYDTFPKQEQERNKRATSSKANLDAAKQRAMAAHDNWRRAQEAADRETGRPANFADPMAPKSASASSTQ